jgi:hypothetical protein
MKRVLTACGVIAGLFLAGPGFAQSKAKAQNVPEIAFESVPNFLKFPPNIYLGEGIGVATNSKGHVFVYTRSGDTRLFEFDQNGVFVREIGVGLYGFTFAHAVRVDKDDNIWTVDEGSNMVIKFNPAGRVTMVIGRRPDPVDELTAMTGQGSAPQSNRPYSFNRPTDVGWDAQGNIFVTDGYGDNRVVKYDKNGRFLKQIGSEKPGSEPNQFNTPHGIAVDAQGNVYVSDRANHRMQVFDNNLGPKAIYDNIGDSWTVCISPGPHQYLFTSNSNPNGNTPGSWAKTGQIYKLELDGTVVGKFGHAGKLAPGFQVVHMMDCRNPNQIVVGEIESWRMQKFVLKGSK